MKAQISSLRSEMNGSMSEKMDGMQSQMNTIQSMLMSLVPNMAQEQQQQQTMQQVMPLHNDQQLIPHSSSDGGRNNHLERGRLQQNDQQLIPQSSSEGGRNNHLERGRLQQTRLKSVQERMKKIKPKDTNDYSMFLRILKTEMEEDLEHFNLEINRFTIDENPELEGRCCIFYQFNGCPGHRPCNKPFIHGHERTRIHRDERNRNMRDQNWREDSSHNFIHGCILCQSMRKGIVNHPLYKCELFSELDNHEKDPMTYKSMFFMKRPKPYKIRVKKDLLTPKIEPIELE